MPGGRMYNHTRRRKNYASKTIAKAWRQKKQRQQSLLQRTTLANRQQIKQLFRSVDTNMIDNTAATPTNSYG